MKVFPNLIIILLSFTSIYSYSASIPVDTYLVNVYEEWNAPPDEVDPPEKMARGRLIYFDSDGSFTEIWGYIIAFKGKYFLSEGDGQTRLFGMWKQKGNKISITREMYNSYGGYNFAKGKHPLCAPKTEEFTLSEDGTISLGKYIFSVGKLDAINADITRKLKDEYKTVCNDL